MRFDSFTFGSLKIDGTVYEHDVIIDRGEIRKRKKTLSKKYQEQFGHTPLPVKAFGHPQGVEMSTRVDRGNA